jgi:hypothetical protein
VYVVHQSGSFRVDGLRLSLGEHGQKADRRFVVLVEVPLVVSGQSRDLWAVKKIWRKQHSGFVVRDASAEEDHEQTLHREKDGEWQDVSRIPEVFGRIRLESSLA